MIRLNREKILVEVVDNTGTYISFFSKFKIITILPRLRQTYLLLVPTIPVMEVVTNSATSV